MGEEISVGGVRKVLLTAIIKVVMFSGSILVVQVIAQVYGVEEVGIYSAAFSIVLLFGLVFRSGLPVLLLRYRVQYPNQNSKTQYLFFLQRLIDQPSRRVMLIFVWMALLLYASFLRLPLVWLSFIVLTPVAFFGGWLQLRASYFKAIGQPMVASVLDMGVIQLYMTALIAMLYLLGFEIDLFPLLCFVGGTALILCAGIVWHRPEKTGCLDDNFSVSEQRIILTNALLTFIYRNGYPLLFGLFVSASHLGYFRIEERLALMSSFATLLVETLAMKRIIKAFQDLPSSQIFSLYLRLLVYSVIPAALISMLLAYVISFESVGAALNVSDESTWRYAVFAASPVFAFIQFNTLILNLQGYYKTIATNMIIIFVVFIGLSYVLYDNDGLGGLRFAYLLASVLASIFIGIATIRVLRNGKK